MKKGEKLTDYFGKRIKRSHSSPDAILDGLKVKERCLLEYQFPKVLGKEEIYPGVHEIQKWEGNKKYPFVFMAKSFTGWFRLATKTEADIFKMEEKQKRGK